MNCGRDEGTRDHMKFKFALSGQDGECKTELDSRADKQLAMLWVPTLLFRIRKPLFDCSATTIMNGKSARTVTAVVLAYDFPTIGRTFRGWFVCWTIVAEDVNNN